MPLHAQLRTAIDRRIASGEWAERLPAERRLCEMFGVSRLTLRRALRQLAADGQLVTQHGSGNYVMSRAPRKQLLPLSGLPRQGLSGAERADATILSVDAGRPSPPLARALQLQPGERVLTVRRLRWIGGRPAALETIAVPASRFPDLGAETLAAPMDATLSRRHAQLRLSRALSQWQAVPCPPADARLLEIGAGSPVFRLHRISFDMQGQPVEQVESYVRGDLYGFQAELQERTPNTGGIRPVVPFRRR